MKSVISIGLFIALIFSADAFAKVCSVKGRVVDDAGQPVSAAFIYLGGEYRDDIDSLIVTNAPDENGFFKLERTCGENPFYFFITSAYDQRNAFVPIEPPFTMLEGRNKDFPNLAGIRIKDREADLGNIRVQTHYRAVRIRFEDASGANLFPTYNAAADVYFKIKNEKGKLADFAALSKETAFSDSGVALTLPEGRWLIEVALRRGKGKTLRAENLVEISRNDADLREISLKMAKRK